MKWCPYCLAGHTRARARYCSPEHAAAAARQNARADGKLRRYFARRRRHEQKLALGRSRWREIAAGRNAERLIADIFGTPPPP